MPGSEALKVLSDDGRGDIELTVCEAAVPMSHCESVWRSVDRSAEELAQVHFVGYHLQRSKVRMLGVLVTHSYRNSIVAEGMKRLEIWSINTDTMRRNSTHCADGLESTARTL